MRHLSEPAGRVSKKNFSSKYVALGRIISDWDSIIGADMVKYAQPVRLNTRQYKNRRSKPECVLDIACSSSHAMILQYQKTLILERMATIFGNCWVTDIKFRPAQTLKQKQINKPVINRRNLCDQDHDFIDKTIESLDDTAIKSTLRRMGQYILQESEAT